MIGKVLSIFSGGLLKSITEPLNRAYEAKLNAANDSERIAADELIASLHAQQAILVAEQGSWMTRWVRPAFAFPFILYDSKVVIWDKVLGWGVTDDLSPEFWQLHIWVFTAYFVGRGIEKGFGKIRR